MTIGNQEENKKSTIESRKETIIYIMIWIRSYYVKLLMKGKLGNSFIRLIMIMRNKKEGARKRIRMRGEEEKEGLGRVGGGERKLVRMKMTWTA